MPARKLATHLGVRIVSPLSIKGLTQNAIEAITDPDSGFSAVTILAQPTPFIIYNHKHTPARQESDLMHELAHLIEDHSPVSFTMMGKLPCRSFNPSHESEAEWLGGCLQICRDGLVWAIREGLSDSEIAEHFGASLEMVQFRRRMTGVDRQIQRNRR
ncbi:ImmA/IrrE family metallo-endopeptidase [Cytophagaceae bacterium YF14B1]|uniref:ImmA/IrrE family metallo-endopeptidase n=1 Tax=Xanthocytophaga flava TaxID=3048013 RepID=A0AAE3R082_9BACT|nr:ImmA/IrrE family metallo-endopeptidase [Xanthocytophaga flavus]MDJ1485949.1 ImmA/IrrE family metallo-endopeptidase [Xanthocytophaga flavus]